MNPLLETYLIKAENFLYQRGISFIRASIGVLVNPDCKVFESCQWHKFIVTVLPDNFVSLDKAFMLIRDYTEMVWSVEEKRLIENTVNLIWFDMLYPEYDIRDNQLGIIGGVRLHQRFPEINIGVIVS